MQYDFLCFDILRHPLWENQKIESWYRQNIFLYIHKSKAHLLTQQGFKPTSNPQHLVIPELFAMYACGYASLHSRLEKKWSEKCKKFLRKIYKMLTKNK
ncbi:hypothetical protein OQH61_07735 [Helicobacter sp. MIT 21-1697]|uniref:hypothetical protein n=1 Tax=Helicobacter sp. MIT 21-1697 TaxID=2993733 RepID=UPI00224B6C31|nr:hypothetical protein [Helicobacter sp. MIT 21-1697]MCX2717622.1 hypothetical protein [Helicobacter sp. MIT 21-1697]